jgi:rhodanese-related sulfurtransferase
LDFLFENIFLVGLIIISGVLLFFPKVLSRDNKVLGSKEVTLLINREPAMLVDVRSEADFRAGHITNAINIPLDQIEVQINKITSNSKKNIIVYCQKGVRSAQAFRLLNKLGLPKLYTIEGGLDAWLKNNLPIIEENK